MLLYKHSSVQIIQITTVEHGSSINEKKREQIGRAESVLWLEAGGSHPTHATHTPSSPTALELSPVGRELWATLSSPGVPGWLNARGYFPFHGEYKHLGVWLQREMSQRLELLCPAVLPGFQIVQGHHAWLLQNQDGCECKALFHPFSAPVKTRDSFNSFPNPAKLQGTLNTYGSSHGHSGSCRQTHTRSWCLMQLGLISGRRSNCRSLSWCQMNPSCGLDQGRHKPPKLRPMKAMANNVSPCKSMSTMAAGLHAFITSPCLPPQSCKTR